MKFCTVVGDLTSSPILVTIGSGVLGGARVEFSSLRIDLHCHP